MSNFSKKKKNRNKKKRKNHNNLGVKTSVTTYALIFIVLKKHIEN